MDPLVHGSKPIATKVKGATPIEAEPADLRFSPFDLLLKPKVFFKELQLKRKNLLAWHFVLVLGLFLLVEAMSYLNTNQSFFLSFMEFFNRLAHFTALHEFLGIDISELRNLKWGFGLGLLQFKQGMLPFALLKSASLLFIKSSLIFLFLKYLLQKNFSFFFVLFVISLVQVFDIFALFGSAVLLLLVFYLKLVAIKAAFDLKWRSALLCFSILPMFLMSLFLISLTLVVLGVAAVF